MIDKNTLRTLVQVIKSKKPDIELVEYIIESVPDILDILPYDYVNKIDREHAIRFLGYSKHNANYLKYSKDPFIRNLCEFFITPNYKTTYTLTKKDIPDLIKVSKSNKNIGVQFSKPLFIIPDKVAKQLIEKVGELNDYMLWHNFLQYQIKKEYVAKYWKLDYNTLGFMPFDSYTQEMVDLLFLNKDITLYKHYPQINQSSRFVDIYKKRPDLMTNKHLAYAIKERLISSWAIHNNKSVYGLCSALEQFQFYQTLDRENTDDETQVYFDLINNDKEMGIEYLIDKISKIPRTPAK